MIILNAIFEIIDVFILLLISCLPMWLISKILYIYCQNQNLKHVVEQANETHKFECEELIDEILDERSTYKYLEEIYNDLVKKSNEITEKYNILINKYDKYSNLIE